MQPRYLFFLSVLLFDASLFGQSELIFPYFAVGGPYETVLQVMNEVDSGNSITIETYGGSLNGQQNGKPLYVEFDRAVVTASLTLTLSPYQEYSTVMRLSFGSPTQNGWVRVRSNTAGGKVSGSLIFRQIAGGRLVDSVGVSGAQKYRYAVVHVDNREDRSNAGIAFANPDSSEVTVFLDLYQKKLFLGSFSVTLQPHQQFAKLITELFPDFGTQQGTLVVETSQTRSVPVLALRLDAEQLTSIPVRPLGFVFQYEIRNDANSMLENGIWMFNFEDFNLTGVGQRSTDPPGTLIPVRGSWLGTSFQFMNRTTLSDNSIGVVVFNGTSAGQEATKEKRISGKVTTLDGNGRIISVANFTAYHLFGTPPAE